MKKLTYDVSCGDHISRACHQALLLAKSQCAIVRFKFNDISLFASPKKCVETMLWEFDNYMGRSSSRYRASQKGRIEAQKRRDEITGKQQFVDSMMQAARHGHFKNGLNETIQWLETVCESMDDCGVSFDKGELYRLFQQAGYVQNQHVGRPPNDFKTDANLIGEYIVGQVMDCLNSGMPPHPVTKSLCEKYWLITPERTI